jgi:hypothetical protein
MGICESKRQGAFDGSFGSLRDLVLDTTSYLTPHESAFRVISGMTYEHSNQSVEFSK